MNYSITQNGKPLDKSKYTIDEKSKTFSSNEDDLVLDFHGLEGWTFKTGSNCTFDTGGYCTFNTSGYCTFKTGSCCTFDTGGNCTFDTGSNCTFNTSSDCTFKTGRDCTFQTGSNCTFKTGGYCTFKTGSNCTFKTGRDCTFNIYDNFKSIQTRGNSTILITNKKIHDYLEDEVIIYFGNNKLLYTENKLSREKYKMITELVK